MTKRFAAIGAGPATIFFLNEFITHQRTDATFDIFEAKDEIGVGMPYSQEGADDEHICNLSCEEIPDLVQPVAEWLEGASATLLDRFGIDRNNVDKQAALPRLLFGEYLKDQFATLLKMAKERGLDVRVHTGTRIKDVHDLPQYGKIQIDTEKGASALFDKVIIATGHVWPKMNEDKINGYFDSPYPPKKISRIFNHHVGLRGASLTAVDAVKTLAKNHGQYSRDEAGGLIYTPNEGTENFKIVMHSRQGILPCPRFHFNYPMVTHDLYIKQADISAHRLKNNGRVALDFIFDKGFKQPLAKDDPEFYSQIKDMSLEEFVSFTLEQRGSAQPFFAFENEVKVSKTSLDEAKPIYWKETIGFLNAAVNYSAKHMSAEDLLRVRRSLMPLISNIIAYLPHNSSEELIALHKAGKLELVAVGANSALSVDAGKAGAGIAYKDEQGRKQEVHFDTFVDCVGQRQMPFEAFPFPGMATKGTVAPAQVRFASSEKAQLLLETSADISENGGDYFLKVPGIAINDNLQVIGTDGKANPRLYILAVPYIGGLNPDFSGLDFCELAARKVWEKISEPELIFYPPLPPSYAVI